MQESGFESVPSFKEFVPSKTDSPSSVKSQIEILKEMYTNWGALNFDQLALEDIMIASKDERNRITPYSIHKQYSDRVLTGQLNANN